MTQDEPNIHNKNNLPQKSFEKLVSTTKKGYGDLRRSLDEVEDLKCRLNTKRVFVVEVTKTL